MSLLKKGLIAAAALLLGAVAWPAYQFCGLFSCRDAVYLFRPTPEMDKLLTSLRQVGGVTTAAPVFPCRSNFRSVAYRCRFKVGDTYLTVGQEWATRQFILISLPHHWDAGGRGVHLVLVETICGLSREEADRALVFLGDEFISRENRYMQSYKVGQCHIRMLRKEILFDILAHADALVMHPSPMNRGVEISSEVADGAQSLVREQVEMHLPNR